MMDREKKDELPQMQVEFIDVICLPLYKVNTILYLISLTLFSIINNYFFCRFYVILSHGLRHCMKVHLKIENTGKI